MNDLSYTLISGATGGLGKCFALQTARENQNLILTARSLEKLNALSQSINENYGVKIEVFACDLSDADERKAMFDFIIEKNLKVNSLINVAGVDIQMPFSSYKREKLIFQTRVLFESTVDLTHFVLSKNSSDIKILTISSICGISAMPYFAVYSALKGGLISFFDSLRYEYNGNKNVIITTILPGSIPTRADIIEDIKKQGLTGKLSQKPPEYIVKKSLSALSRRRKNYIPGFYNRVIALISRLMPNGLRQKIIARKFANKQKDAF